MSLVKIGYSYVRFSSPGQAAGDSLRRQTELSQLYCEKHDITLDTSLDLTDLGISAFKGMNAATGRLGAFLRACEEGRVKPGSYLLIENLDRLSRASIMDAFSLFARILNHDITIVTLTDQKEYTKSSCNDIGNILMSIIFMMRAHDESLQKSKRISAAWVNKRVDAANGKILTRRIPSWLTVIDNKIVPIPERCELLKRMFQMCIDGMGKQAIAKTLNEEGIEAWGIPGWYGSYIHSIFHSKSVYGEFTPHRRIDGKKIPQEPISDYYPVIITRETYAASARAIASRRGRGGAGSSTPLNLFACILKCADCGSSLVRITKGPKRLVGPVMVCDNGRWGRSKCRYKPWSYAEVETAILKEIRELNLPDLINNTEQGATLRNLHKQVQQIETHLTDIGTRIASILNAIETTTKDIPILTTRLQHLTDEQDRVTSSKDLLLKEYEIELNKLPSIHKAQDDIRSMSDQMLTPETRFKIRSRLRELITRIDVYLSIRKLIIRYKIGQSDDESKTIVRFKSGKSVTFT